MILQKFAKFIRINRSDQMIWWKRKKKMMWESKRRTKVIDKFMFEKGNKNMKSLIRLIRFFHRVRSTSIQLSRTEIESFTWHRIIIMVTLCYVMLYIYVLTCTAVKWANSASFCFSRVTWVGKHSIQNT